MRGNWFVLAVIRGAHLFFATAPESSVHVACGPPVFRL
jgi:hypothetical protein